MDRRCYVSQDHYESNTVSKKRIKFSEVFGLKKDQHELDFVDVPVNAGDIPLFIDPHPLRYRQDTFSFECRRDVVDFFQEVLNAIRGGKSDHALELLSHLKEPNQTRLGLSTGARPRGRGVGAEQAELLLESLVGSQAVKTGLLKDLEDCSLLIEGIGPDKISDITTNIVRKHLLTYTEEQCQLWNVRMRNVPAGAIWEGSTVGWKAVYASLPEAPSGPVVLVPKSIVRRRTVYDGSEYYNRDILEYLQAEALNTGSSLVRLLKSGERRPPHKKVLKEKNPYSKDFLYRFSKDHPKVLDQYRRSKGIDSIQELSDEDILQAQELDRQIDWKELSEKLDKIPVGPQDASAFHDHVVGLLSAVLHPTFIFPRKELGIDQGRKRVDLTFENAARLGFFYDLVRIKKVPCSYLFVECKNYSSDPANPELDQLFGRFDIRRGQFGLLVCRKITDKKLLTERCRDAAMKRQQYVVALDDKDLTALVEIRRRSDELAFNKFFADRFVQLSV
jgi:hypothetical protein